MKSIFRLGLALFLSLPAFIAKGQTQPPATDSTYRYTETMPVFMGSPGGIGQFIAENTRYPEASLRQGIHGTVYTSFVIDSTGKITNPRILKSPGEELSAEALRVISLMPDFIPGTQNGKPVPVIYNLPFRFNIKGLGANPAHFRYYKADGLSFTYLKNWKVNAYPTEKGTEIKLERKGFGNTGTVFISYDNDTTNAPERLKAVIEKIAKRSENSVPISFNEPRETTYQTLKAWKSEGQMQLNQTGQNLIGTMRITVYTFNANKRSYTLKILQTDDDRAENQVLLDLLERSFNPYVNL